MKRSVQNVDTILDSLNPVDRGVVMDVIDDVLESLYTRLDNRIVLMDIVAMAVFVHTSEHIEDLSKLEALSSSATKQ